MRHRNPPFPIVPVILGAAGVAGLVWWVTRQSTIATTQALVGGAANAALDPRFTALAAYAPPSTNALSYTGDVIGRSLTPAETARMYDPQMDPTRLAGGIPIDDAMMAVARANFARINPQ